MKHITNSRKIFPSMNIYLKAEVFSFLPWKEAAHEYNVQEKILKLTICLLIIKKQIAASVLFGPTHEMHENGLHVFQGAVLQSRTVHECLIAHLYPLKLHF